MTVFPPDAVTETRVYQPDDGGEPIEIVGVRTPELCRLTGLSYRQVDYWCRIGYLEAEGEGSGSGSQRLFTADEVAFAQTMHDLIGVGLNLKAAYLAAIELTGDCVVALTPRLYLTRVP